MYRHRHKLRLGRLRPEADLLVPRLRAMLDPASPRIKGDADPRVHGVVGVWLERRYNSDDEGPLELSTYPSNILHGAQVFRLMEERGDAAELRAEAAEKRSPRTR